MAITISITESPLQLLAGIPSSLTLNTNVPSTIFYTLNGTDPDFSSNVYIDTFALPTNSGQIVFKAFATNGIDTSPIITQIYTTNVVPARHPFDTVQDLGNNCNKAKYPFGSPSSSFNQPVIFGNTGGVIVDDNNPDRQADGYDGFGNPAGYYTPPKERYKFLFSETNDIGERGEGIGTLPARVIWAKPRNDNEHAQSSNMQRPGFDPKAMVIFQDSREDSYDPDVPKINRPYFDLEDQAKARDGSLLTNIDTVTPSGGFVKAHFNPKDNILTYYYYDNRVARWIISKEPYHPFESPTINMSSIVTRSSRGEGLGKVFKWIPFKYHRLI